MSSGPSNPTLWSYARACRRLAARIRPPQDGAGGGDADTLEPAITHLEQAAQQLGVLAGAHARLPQWLVENVMTTMLGPDCDEAVLDSAPSADHVQVLRATGEFASTADLIAFVCSLQLGGILEVVSPTERFELEFVAGDIVHARSDEAPPGDRLGDILVAHGAVTRAEVESVLRESPGKRVGLALWQRWLVTEQQLRAALEEQIRRLFARMFELPSLRHVFWSGPPLRTQQQPRMDATGLFLDSMRAAGGREPRD